MRGFLIQTDSFIYLSKKNEKYKTVYRFAYAVGKIATKSVQLTTRVFSPKTLGILYIYKMYLLDGDDPRARIEKFYFNPTSSWSFSRDRIEDRYQTPQSDYRV